MFTVKAGVVDPVPEGFTLTPEGERAVDAFGEVTLTLSVKLTEVELRALNGIAGYSDDAIAKAIFDGLGRHYVEPHAAGLRSFFGKIRGFAPALLLRATAARKNFENNRK